MHKLAKRILPQTLLRKLRAERVRHNRRSLVKASARSRPLTVVPDNGVEHYYHFLLDLSLPLYLLLQAADRDATFSVQTTGPFLPRLQQMFPGRVLIPADNGVAAGDDAQPLLGMNPVHVEIARDEVLAFSRHVRSTFGVGETMRSRKVLLIERLPPDPFFARAAKKTGAGTSRRSIPNHAELIAALEPLVKPPFEFCNVQLENISFDDQVRLFAEAAVVIGQHGAGLANAMWMAPGSAVVELTNNVDLRHFQMISGMMGHVHVNHSTSGPHALIEVDRLLEELANETRLESVLSRRSE